MPSSEVGSEVFGARGGAVRFRATPRNTEKSATLQATSTSLAIPTAISFALFAQLVLVEASLS